MRRRPFLLFTTLALAALALAAPAAAQGTDPVELRFAFLEETYAHALAAIRFLQHRLAAVKHARAIVAVLQKRSLEFVGFVLHRDRGRGADHARTVAREHDHRFRALHVGLQVLALVVDIAVIEIGKIAKYFDAQPRQLGDMRRERIAADAFDA